MAQPNYKAILGTAVEMLKEQGLEGAGTVDGLNAYAVLLEIQNQATAFEVPLKDVGLDGFDLDQLLRKPLKKAA